MSHTFLFLSISYDLLWKAEGLGTSCKKFWILIPFFTLSRACFCFAIVLFLASWQKFFLVKHSSPGCNLRYIHHLGITVAFSEGSLRLPLSLILDVHLSASFAITSNCLFPLLDGRYSMFFNNVHQLFHRQKQVTYAGVIFWIFLTLRRFFLAISLVLPGKLAVLQFSLVLMELSSSSLPTTKSPFS